MCLKSLTTFHGGMIWLAGAQVTDTMMISTRMYLSRDDLNSAIALLKKVWTSRTG